MPKLQDHLLSRLRNPDQADVGAAYPIDEREQITLHNNRFFPHQILRINYTTYDLRRDQDIINPRLKADIMFPAPDIDIDTGLSATGHPFAYAHVLGLFHADVYYTVPGVRPKQHTMDFVWVRYYRLDTRYKAGFKHKRLHRVELLPEDHPDAFGFIDPDDIIRGAHIVPAFTHGTITESGAASERWMYHYINM